MPINLMLVRQKVNIMIIMANLLLIIIPIGIIVGLVLYFKKKKDKTGIP
jgi:uncharacterized phage infection (PIP) family protein YhgE